MTPQVLSGTSGQKKDGHMHYTQDQVDLSGPSRIRAMFSPAHRVSLHQAGKPIGLSYSRLYRRIKEGTINLKVQKDELGRMFISIEDLISYLYPPKDAPLSNDDPTPPKKTKEKQKFKTKNV
jgi:hypothetical protein